MGVKNVYVYKGHVHMSLVAHVIIFVYTCICLTCMYACVNAYALMYTYVYADKYLYVYVCFLMSVHVYIYKRYK